MPGDWSRDEVEVIVGDYFEMLRKELSGKVYSKTRHRQALARELSRRSDGSIEFKHANISALLVTFSQPYIPGYKPRGNYQLLLEQVVLEYLATNPDFRVRGKHILSRPGCERSWIVRGASRTRDNIDGPLSGGRQPPSRNRRGMSPP
jgi:hypothetical protein